MQVQVQQLKVGDVMLGTGEIVILITDGILCPAGKLRVGLKNIKKNKERWTYWGKHTKVHIYDREPNEI